MPGTQYLCRFLYETVKMFQYVKAPTIFSDEWLIIPIVWHSLKLVESLVKINTEQSFYWVLNLAAPAWLSYGYTLQYKKP